MIIKLQNIVILKLCLIALSLLYCKTGDNIVEFKFKDEFRGKTSRIIESNEKIGNSRTFQIIFSISEYEKCIKVSIKSSTTNRNIKKNRLISINTFYIIHVN